MKNYKVGDKIYFKSERRPYTIKARDERYLICTKPYNIIHRVLYTIVDLKELIREPNNLIFNAYDYKNQEDIEDCLKDLRAGKIEVSARRCIGLDILENDSND